MKRNNLLIVFSGMFLALGTFATATTAYGESSKHGHGTEIRKGNDENNGKDDHGGKAGERERGAPHSVKLTNLGDESLSNIDIRISGKDAGDFSETDDCRGKLEGHESCTINVTFTPTSRGAKTATMEVRTPEDEHDVALSGAGI